MLLALFLMIRIVPLVEDAAMDQGMQGFDPAIEHLGKSGEIRDIRYFNPGITHLLRRAAGGKNFHAKLGQCLGKPLNSGFIRQADQCPFHLFHNFPQLLIFT